MPKRQQKLATAKAKRGPIKLCLTKYAAIRLAVSTHPRFRRKEAAMAAVHDALRGVVDSHRIDELAESEALLVAAKGVEADVDSDAYTKAIEVFFRSTRPHTLGQAFRYGLEEYLKHTP